ncbi:MAG: hypothetical protein R3C15_16395 [Thermoleophilia bacterium]
MPTSRTRTLVALAGGALALALGGSALAATGPAPRDDDEAPEAVLHVAMDVEAVDLGRRSVTGVLRCAPGELSGRLVTLRVASGVGLGDVVVPSRVGEAIRLDDGRPKVAAFEETACDEPAGDPVSPGEPPLPPLPPLPFPPVDDDGQPTGPWQVGEPGALPGDPVGPDDPETAADDLPVPPRGFFRKTLKLHVDLEDAADGPVFTASLNRILRGVPKRVRSFLNEKLRGDTFELDATDARCFADGERIACDDLAEEVLDAADPIEAVVLVRADEITEDGFAFTARKVATRG